MIETKEVVSKKDILKNVLDFYTQNTNKDELYNSGEHTGGKIRRQNGKMIDDIVEYIITELCKLNNIENYSLQNKKELNIKVQSKRGYIHAGVNIHLLINNKIVLVCDCKLALDSCYLTRTNSEMFHFKKLDRKIKRVVISLEKDISDVTENYFKDLRNVNKIFYLTNGNRSSKKQIWLSGTHKEIDVAKLRRFINYLDRIIKKSVIV